jgi:hypothetical protein
VKHRRLPRFDSDYKKLSALERELFRQALSVFIAASKGYHASPEKFEWPRSLRVERLTGTGVMAMTWSFSGPDGRATFQFETIDGDIQVVWRRVGRHQIYREP